MSDEYRRGLEAAAKIAELFESELRRMAVDTWMTSPIHRGDYSEEGYWKELAAGEEGHRLGKAAEAAENIAAAIRSAMIDAALS